MNTVTNHLRLALPLVFGGVWFQVATLLVLGFIVSVSV